MSTEYRKGVLTTEFWITVINTVLMILASVGLVSNDLIEDIKVLLVPFIGAIIPIVAYIISRMKVKTA